MWFGWKRVFDCVLFWDRLVFIQACMRKCVFLKYYWSGLIDVGDMLSSMGEVMFPMFISGPGAQFILSVNKGPKQCAFYPEDHLALFFQENN